MSREVTELRHQGKLKEAYELAIREREQEPGEWADAALFWVLYDMAKLHLLKSDSQAKAEAKRCIDIMQELTYTMADSNGLGKENLKIGILSSTEQSSDAAQISASASSIVMSLFMGKFLLIRRFVRSLLLNAPIIRPCSANVNKNTNLMIDFYRISKSIPRTRRILPLPRRAKRCMIEKNTTATGGHFDERGASSRRHGL